MSPATAPVRRIAGGVDRPVAWGMPWPRGEVAADSGFHLGGVPVQSWPLATWPDGSLKWSGHAVAGLPDGEHTLAPGEPEASADPVSVTETAEAVVVRTGATEWRVPRSGNHLVTGIGLDGTPVARDVELVSERRGVPAGDRAGSVPAEEWVGQVRSVSVEQSGPVRAVLRLDGVHVPRATTDREVEEWLPFRVRLYATAGSPDLRIVHTLLWDADPATECLAGLGLRVAVPLREDPLNRHVRIAGPMGADGRPGFLTEAAQGITGLRRDAGAEARDAQISGRRITALSEVVERLLRFVPVWNDWRLEQHSPDGFTLAKRTSPDCSWVKIPGGGRSAGFAYLGDPSGGVGVGLRDFWQSYPTRIDVAGAGADAGSLTLWLWSPSAPPMDLRSYHDGLGIEGTEEELRAMDITYEDYQPGFSDPRGIARTHELHLIAYAATPTGDDLARDAASVQDPAVAVAPVDYLHEQRIFGDWAPVDRSTPDAERLEDRLEWLVDYYVQQRELRRWYGFWDYGDVMHTYDVDRHQWRYDVGGFAWDNSELSPDLFLWHQFLRTGSPRTYRFAEAMTRHTGEVDVYHQGRFAMLGSRHNVQHWGCSAKQARISSAIYRRIFYYLSADERTGDLLGELAEVERAFAVLDPNRKVRADGYVANPDVVSIGLGTDWSALAAAWLTAWERVGDPAVRERARDRLLGTMEGIAALPRGFLSGEARLRLATGRFDAFPDQIQVSHLSAVFGLVEVCSELIRLTEGTPEEVPGFAGAWEQYCRLYLATPEEQRAEVGQQLTGISLVQGHSRLSAWLAHRRGDEELARRAWESFDAGVDRLNVNPVQRQRVWETTTVEGPEVLRPVTEAAWVSTNDAAQYGLAVIQNLALIPAALPSVPASPGAGV